MHRIPDRPAPGHHLAPAMDARTIPGNGDPAVVGKHAETLEERPEGEIDETDRRSEPVGPVGERRHPFPFHVGEILDHPFAQFVLAFRFAGGQQIVEISHPARAAVVDPDPCLGTQPGTFGHQGRFGKPLVDEFVDDRRFPDHLVGDLHHRNLGIGRDVLEPGGLVGKIDFADREIQALLDERHVGALGEGTNFGCDEFDDGHGLPP